MTPNDFKIVAENIDDFIEVPDGVSHLRKAVLTLAISGKLTPQEKSDGTAEELYNHFQSDQSKNTEDKKKKSKEFSEITEEEIPFDIPKSWKWIRLGDCMNISSGDLLKVSEATEGEYLVYGGNGVAGRHSKYNAIKGTIVIGRVGALCGIAHITETNAWVTDNAFIVTYPEELLDKDFFAVLLNNLNLRKSHRGSAQPVISGLSVYPIPMPLPPLAEQKRIVKKVEELMKKIDELEEKKKERDVTRIRLTRSAMQSLSKGDSKVAFEQLIELIKTPTDIKELENALLTLAVSGKLVSQDKNEGTGEDLYAQIYSEIQASGQKKNNQKTHHIVPIELPFDIPKSWCKAELGKITYQITDGTHFTPMYIEKGLPFVSIKDVSGGRLDFSNTKYISEKEHTELIKRCNPQFDDILFCRIGTLGRAVLVDTQNPFSIFVSLGLIKYPTSQILPKYLLTVLNSPCLYAQYDQIKAGGSHTNKLNLKEMPRLIIPLPPLAEQKRIVKKVEEIMVLVNQLKELIKGK